MSRGAYPPTSCRLRRWKHLLHRQIERWLIDLHRKDFGFTESSVGRLYYCKLADEADGKRVERIAEILDKLPWSIRRSMISRKISIFIFGAAPLRIKAVESVIVGRGVDDLSEEDVISLFILVIILVRYRQRYGYSATSRLRGRSRQAEPPLSQCWTVAVVAGWALLGVSCGRIPPEFGHSESAVRSASGRF